MGDLPSREYAALRETIRARAGARPWAVLAGISAWAGLLMSVLIWLPNPIVAVVPLLVLLTTFEVTRSLHQTVERIGRYLQAFYEEHAGADAALTTPAWERTAMLLGPTVPGAGGHPFFLVVFLLATLINFLAVILPAPMTIEIATLALPHAAFIIWLLYCDRRMRRQRATELARYRALKKDSPLSGS